ncbi:MAG: FAD-binding protein [Duodenibacillus sp.]|nr:FAD-binding protein [Duodenibacillus sp.]
MTTRRNLMKSIAAAAALPAAAAVARDLAPGQKWDREADIVVIGYGGAGAASAIAAKDAGADVLILEKMPLPGGNTRACGGGFIVPENADQAYVYLEKTFEFADDEIDREAVRAFCDESVKTNDYLKSLDPDIQVNCFMGANFPQLKGSESIRKYSVKGALRGGGENLFAALDRFVKARGIPVLMETPATQLVRSGGEVVGVIARGKDGKEIAIKARKAVFLTAGGYEYDKASLQTYCQGTQIHGLGNPGNTGDGLRLAQSVGAQLWHMSSYSCPLGAPIPGCLSCAMIRPYYAGCIWVNKDGKRFINETDMDHHAHLYAVNAFDPQHHRYAAIPCWMIFDDPARLSRPLTASNMGYVYSTENYRWSKDCSKEIASGVVQKADTPEELAALIGVPAEALKATLEKWNADIAAGKDTLYGRVAERKGKVVSAPIAKPPFYAMKLYPALLNTQGGPRRNAKGQVIDVFGKPVPRLYAAGELGSIWGTIYQGSSNVAECLVYGRIIGREAAKLKAWG